MPRERGKTVRACCRELMRHVITQVDEESEAQELKYPLVQANRRAVQYCNISAGTVSKIRREGKEAGSAPLTTPGKQRPRKAPSAKQSVSNIELGIIRRIIRNFYLEEKKSPNIEKLLAIVKDRIPFPWGDDTLRGIIKGSGHFFRSTGTRRVLVEERAVASCRYFYLKEMRKFRQEEANLVFLDECCVEDKSNQAIIVAASSSSGFLIGTERIFRRKKTSTTYHITGLEFENWVKDSLLPNLTPKSVVVMDNSPCHSEKVNKQPSKYATKPEMIAWLGENKLPARPGMVKAELWKLIENHRSEDGYRVDAVLNSAGHSVLRLPPHHEELNPLEFAWVEVKSHVSAGGLQTLEQLTVSRALQSCKKNWPEFWSRVEELEKEYWSTDGPIEDIQDDIVEHMYIYGDMKESDEGESSADDDDDSYTELGDICKIDKH
ncbi:hypothetical protein GE061_013133 [Apolygus lucorum]|uniref:Tc1-like transposase DDE domain-containing protein n=1 Tax=Apolygus lucorum TaxID=248454 RepID=A0A6A4JYK8_APOLU|nr:hypothetical protein GE061_013133 [Apolygus lucorum]